ncbi:hypothetical protein GCM10007925_22260 [Sphingomonas astaxanthinifaciens DSM 22298]|uniref:Uncharacterized protein n=2 Tax=Sphingomonas TaxID=13687 RepID=A0ABQ5Z6U1_9SPHN|nr:hypothetical protein GCM10007925_22260 [Sphingomonas astaxanthinifaciens DSM 22298]
MRRTRAALLLLMLASPAAAEAATIVIVTDPMTLERRTLVVDPRGPDRVWLCALPPATTGCLDVTPRRP